MKIFFHQSIRLIDTLFISKGLSLILNPFIKSYQLFPLSLNSQKWMSAGCWRNRINSSQNCLLLALDIDIIFDIIFIVYCILAFKGLFEIPWAVNFKKPFPFVKLIFLFLPCTFRQLQNIPHPVNVKDFCFVHFLHSFCHILEGMIHSQK